MKKIFEKLNKDYYLLLTVLIFVLNIITFLSIKEHIHPVFKHFTFISLLVISFYMFPYQTLKSNSRIEFISKIIYCITIVYMALCVFLKFENFEILGKILMSIFGIFTFYLLSLKSPESKKMFKSHFFLNFILVGVVTMYFFEQNL